MNSILLKTSAAISKLPIGSSKFFGNPDFPKGIEWPAVTFDGELYDLSFMCQINCETASLFDKDGILPKRGMLYFFYDLDEMPWEPSNLNAARVIYFDGNISELKETVLVDENGNELAFAEQKIDFEVVSEGYLSDNLPTHLLLGSPSLDYGTHYDCFKNWQMLLQIDSFETQDTALNFTDEGILCFYIDPEKMKKLDFSDVRIQQIYS